MTSRRQLVPIARLRLNKENDRHGALTSEFECIQWLLTNHREHMLNLAENIAEFGLSPIDSVLVLPTGDGTPNSYEVWEGNRRVAAIKLLDDPNRCHDPGLRRRFSEIKSSVKTRIPTAIECVIAASTEEADRLIELRHQGAQEGVGTVAWDPIQKDRHQKRLGKKGRYEFSNHVLEAVIDKVDPSIKRKIEDEGFPISTLDRILKNPDAQKFLGLTNASGTPHRLLEEKETLKGLNKVLADVAGGMHVSEVYNSKAIKKYLKTFEAKNTPNQSKTVKTPASLALSTIGTPTASPRSKPLSQRRARLIPSGVTYAIKERRINSVYHELRKKLDVTGSPNAVAVLFRVFLELSVDLYLDKHKLTRGQRERLASKADRVEKHMTSQGWLSAPDSKGIKTAIHSTHNVHSVDTFHAYVHDYKFQPIATDLNTSFDNLKPFFDVLFKHTR